MFSVCNVIKKTVISLGLISLAGCATPPVIDTSKIKNVKSVTIVDIPEVRVHALVGQLPNTYGIVHFSDDLAAFYDVEKARKTVAIEQANTEIGKAVVETQIMNTPDTTVVSAGLSGAAAGATAGLINAMGESANENAANFNEIFEEKNPNLNIRHDFLTGLTKALEGKGIKVYLASDQLSHSPYFRWDAPNKKGASFQQQYPDALPAVDTDILIQVSPIVLFNAQSALNAYARIASVGIAVYDGRTKEFFGYQELSSVDGLFDYHVYDNLVKDINVAGPAIHAQLMMLIPAIADAMETN